jgi:hypothetical protein
VFGRSEGSGGREVSDTVLNVLGTAHGRPVTLRPFGATFF